MHRHPEFDLWMHDDDELAAFVGGEVVERATIHQWPLSCVQRLRTASGPYIYKVSAPPTLEAEFYARARSPLLVPVRVLPSQGTTTALLMAEVAAPRLGDRRPPTEPEAAALAAELIRQIGAIEGELPALLDIRGEERWLAFIRGALDDVRACVDDGSFRRVDLELVARLRHWAESPTVLEAVSSPGGYVHSDLKAENVLVADGGHLVLDWQRPIRGPVALDAATLLISLGYEATRHVPLGIVQVYNLLLVAWFAQSGRRWVPQGRPWFDGIIARLAGELARLDAGG